MKSLDLSDTGGDLNLINKKVRDWIEVTEIRKETFIVVTSAGMATQRKDKIGYEIMCGNGETKPVTAYLNDALGTVNGYNKEYTELLVNSFAMNKELSDYFRKQTVYDSQEICAVLGLQNASDLIYDKAPRDLGLIHPHSYPIFGFLSLHLLNS